MKYDDASWHYGNEFPENSPDIYGGTHIALFLKWCFVKGWAGELHLDEELDDTQRVINGDMSATEFFFKYCDGKLTDEDFSQAGNDFALLYYGEDGLYLNDYAENFFELMYLAPESDHDFNKFYEILEQRFNSRVLTTVQQKRAKPWWKFW